MNRRETLKNLAIGAIGVGIAAEACKPGDKKPEATADKDALKGINIDRMEAEKVYEQSLIDQGKFFTDAEMATITILANIIIPKDDVSGSASDAGVPEFINFIVLDMPHHQVPMRGGLRWLDMQCLSRFGKDFSSCSKEQQMEMVDAIAWPEKAKPEMAPGVSFFNRMRNLTATGFYTSEMGVNDLGYMGNRPNQWNGVPDDVLKQYGMSYSEKELRECISFDKA